MKPIQSHIWIMGVIVGCISSYDTDYRNEETRIVINGTLTNEDIPQIIKIFETMPIDFDSDVKLSSTSWISGARVQIKEMDGDVYDLVEIDSGRYYTDNNSFLPIVGKSYQLIVKDTPYGDYESVPAKMLDAIPIDDINYAFQPIEFINRYGALEVEDNFDFSIAVTLPEKLDQHFRYRWRGLYEYDTQLNPGNCRTNSTTVVNHCFIEESDVTFLKSINTSGFKRGIEIDNLRILSLNPNRRFAYGYDLEIQQLSIDANAIDYWERVAATYEDVGGLFDPIPSTIGGNIYSPDNPNQIALGYFEVASVSKRRIHLDGSSFDSFGFANYSCICRPLVCRPGFAGSLPPPPDLCCDCLAIDGSSVTKPEYWSD